MMYLTTIVQAKKERVPIRSGYTQHKSIHHRSILWQSSEVEMTILSIDDGVFWSSPSILFIASSLASLEEGGK